MSKGVVKSGVDGLRCEWCGKPIRGGRAGTKYDSKNCRQAAYKNRVRIAERAKNYGFTSEQAYDVNQIRLVSVKAADTLLMLASVAGRDIASKVLDGMWDLFVNAKPSPVAGRDVMDFLR